MVDAGRSEEGATAVVGLEEEEVPEGPATGASSSRAATVVTTGFRCGGPMIAAGLARKPRLGGPMAFEPLAGFGIVVRLAIEGGPDVPLATKGGPRACNGGLFAGRGAAVAEDGPGDAGTTGAEGLPAGCTDGAREDSRVGALMAADAFRAFAILAPGEKAVGFLIPAKEEMDGLNAEEEGVGGRCPPPLPPAAESEGDWGIA